MEKEKRPWGSFTIVYEDEQTKIKKIKVNENCVLSYQSHENRKEDWIILDGVGFVIINGDRREVKKGDHVRIEMGMKHRIGSEEGFGGVSFIEVQTGTYFGEDDIVRYEDIYGRA